jgi:7-cyano-7-deazaguanine synthase
VAGNKTIQKTQKSKGYFTTVACDPSQQETIMTKTVVLLSGGLDSATCLATASASGDKCYALSFDYGQKHHAELAAARRLAAHFKVVAHEVITLSDVGRLGGSALTDQTLTVADHIDSPAVPNTYVPARNTIMLSIALGWAEILDAARIVIGVSAVDYSHYPDCRPEYLEAFRAMAALATKRGITGQPVMIDAPLLYLSKAETIQLGLSLGLDYSLTVSCYRADPEGLACGECSSCFLRKKGFREAHAVDPTRYLI